MRPVKSPNKKQLLVLWMVVDRNRRKKTMSAMASLSMIPSSSFKTPIFVSQAVRIPVNSGFLHCRARFPYSPRTLTVEDEVTIGVKFTRFGSVRCLASALTPELKTTLDKVVTSQKVILFMKGTKDFPQCGFSNTVVQILNSLNVPFETINILENELLRQGLKEYSNWPTFPQLYIEGEFFGGCDIAVEAYKSGELQEVLEKAMCS